MTNRFDIVSYGGKGAAISGALRSEAAAAQLEKRVESVFGKNSFDFSQYVYVNRRTKGILICSGCNSEINKSPKSLLDDKKGCPVCAKEKSRNNLIKATEVASKNSLDAARREFKDKAVKIHGEAYDYSKVKYDGCRNKVVILCKTCGFEFAQRPSDHIYKACGCPRCPNINRVRKAKESVMLDFKSVHGDNFSYEFFEYKGTHVKSTIKCNECNRVFNQTPAHHRLGNGCPFCIESRGEKIISEWLDKNKIKYIREATISAYSTRKKFDFFLTKNETYVEYDGIQHFKPSFGAAAFKRAVNTDNKTNDWCNKNNVKLLRIKYDEDIELKLKELINGN